MKTDFIEEQLPLWDALVRSIFPVGVPERSEWTDGASILQILNAIGESKAMNHTFMPNSGGLDLIKALPSHEQSCIELRMDGLPYIVKPQRLIFHSFPDSEPQWSYFRLETGTLQPTGVYDQLASSYEELGEIDPGEYIDRDYIDSGYYNGESLPSNARTVVRILSGAFVIFSKASIYNMNVGTYDARHERMGDEGFRRYIENVISHLRG
ncbi:serine/threonine protein kinase [Alicyclobacillus sp. TC]|uniref:serine/threonine protein kinase n=1 Tax=Alicyclobacillus sp. TC TaxID=2606450 RepID=UPI001EE41352|nr:serine/threonine protein kinase [Alicyclobacillus sp. TC]